MGFILLRQKQEQAAVEAFREASGIFSKMGDLYNGCTARKGLYEAYWNLNPDSARHELERFNALRDSLYSTVDGQGVGSLRGRVWQRSAARGGLGG